jgi:hypothetical protein
MTKALEMFKQGQAALGELLDLTRAVLEAVVAARTEMDGLTKHPRCVTCSNGSSSGWPEPRPPSLPSASGAKESRSDTAQPWPGAGPWPPRLRFSPPARRASATRGRHAPMPTKSLTFARGTASLTWSNRACSA